MSSLAAIAVASIAISYFSAHPLFWILAWPGTVVHELMHLIVGTVTLGNPVSFNVFPEPPTDRGQCLGSVEFSNIGWWNALPVGIAPLLILPFAIGYAAKMHFEFTWWGWFTAWVVASIISQCWPSGSDWRIAFSNKTGLAFYAFLAYLAIH